MPLPDKDALPLYGSMTGIVLREPRTELIPGIAVLQGYFHIFSSPILAFKETPPGQYTPGPWVPVHGSFNSHQSRVELVVTDTSALDGFSPLQAVWLVAALLRLRAESPVRVSVLANVPLASLPEIKEPWALAFEASGHQTGIFRSQYTELTVEDLSWLSRAIPIAARLYHNERFMRAFIVFDESLWSGRPEVGTVLLWTAMEILFDLSGEQSKTKAICNALASHVALDERDRNRAYNVIRELYEKRGRVVHAGRPIENQDYAQSFALARAAFVKVIDEAKLPPSRAMSLQ